FQDIDRVVLPDTLSVLMNKKCNFRCDFCEFDCKPEDEERIDIEDRLDEIFGTIDNLLCAGDFDKVDEILRNVDMSESGDILIGYLSITLAASHNLSSRADFFRKVSEKLDPAELVGLE
ncbi:hypothetical protein LCGC14_1009950, partial [marine sediment metagenome]